MEEKQYNVNNLYVGVLSRQTARQYGRNYMLINLEYCVLLREGENSFRRVLTDGIYAASSSNTHNQNVIHPTSVMKLAEFKPELMASEKISRSEIKNLEDNELKVAFETYKKYEEFRPSQELCK